MRQWANPLFGRFGGGRRLKSSIALGTVSLWNDVALDLGGSVDAWLEVLVALPSELHRCLPRVARAPGRP